MIERIFEVDDYLAFLDFALPDPSLQPSHRRLGLVHSPLTPPGLFDCFLALWLSKVEVPCTPPAKQPDCSPEVFWRFAVSTGYYFNS